MKLHIRRAAVRVTVLTVLLAAAMLVSACSSDPPPRPTPTPVAEQTTETALGTPVTLAPGEATAISGEGIGLAFHRVAEDSRCPVGVECVTAGSAIAVMSVSGLGDDNVALEFIVPPGGSGQVQAGSYLVLLDSIKPDPPSKDGVEPADYRVTVTVTKP